MAGAASSPALSFNPLLLLQEPLPASHGLFRARSCAFLELGSLLSTSSPSIHGGRWCRTKAPPIPVVDARIFSWRIGSTGEERIGGGAPGVVKNDEIRSEGSLEPVNDALFPGANMQDGEAAAELASRTASVPPESISLGIREPCYEVVEVRSDGLMATKKINRRQLLKSSGLRLRDIRSVDPSLWLTNSMPSLLVREHAILLNLGSLRIIAMKERVLLFDYNRKGGKAFLKLLLPRLNPKNHNGAPSMPFELEVVEAALLSRIQRLEQKLFDLEPRVVALLEVLPNRLTADVLEQLRISKQTLVELGSRAGALKQMLLDLLEDHHAIRRICVMGRNCIIRKGELECSLPSERHVAEEEEEEIEMLLENYLQRCESCHGQAERLLDSAREMEDSIAVNLSSRRLEVSRVELLLQVGTFCVAIGALVAGIFGMNLKSYLEEHMWAFWLTTAGIVVGGVIAFFLM
ncbi:magnesium (Mg) transporter 10 isoform X2 [Wolffia australiana]